MKWISGYESHINENDNQRFVAARNVGVTSRG